MAGGDIQSVPRLHPSLLHPLHRLLPCAPLYCPSNPCLQHQNLHCLLLRWALPRLALPTDTLGYLACSKHGVHMVSRPGNRLSILHERLLHLSYGSPLPSCSPPPSPGQHVGAANSANPCCLFKGRCSKNTGRRSGALKGYIVTASEAARLRPSQMAICKFEHWKGHVCGVLLNPPIPSSAPSYDCAFRSHSPDFWNA